MKPYKGDLKVGLKRDTKETEGGRQITVSGGTPERIAEYIYQGQKFTVISTQVTVIREWEWGEGLLVT